jgi:hypothetical protein
MNDIPIDQQSNRFLDNNTQTQIPHDRLPENESEAKELKFFIFLIVVYAAAYWLFAEYYFV